jgi:hypothetical protein
MVDSRRPRKPQARKTHNKLEDATMKKKQNPCSIAKPLAQEDYVNGKITDINCSMRTSRRANKKRITQ